eukprot:365792-Chlamydomonas_euryale.AAC.4
MSAFSTTRRFDVPVVATPHRPRRLSDPPVPSHSHSPVMRACVASSRLPTAHGRPTPAALRTQCIQ